MNRTAQGKCSIAFRKMDGWHNCRAPLKPGKPHRHDTSAGPPEKGDQVARRKLPGPGYDETPGNVEEVTKDGRVKATDGNIY